jgi:hypothetical protein
MIYGTPAPDAPLDQGDLIDDCPVLSVSQFDPKNPAALAVESALARVIVLTQTCDFANAKTTVATVAEVHDAQRLVQHQVLKASDVKGPIRSGRVWGVYFLPAQADLGLGEMVVDFRRLHTVQFDLLGALSQAGKRRGRVQPPYREHLAKHFADTFSRIGLPRPYETL